MTPLEATPTIPAKDKIERFEIIGRNVAWGSRTVERASVTPPASEPSLSIREASRLLGVSSSTLRRWSDRKLIAVLLTPGGHRRYSRSAIEELKQRLSSLPPAASADSRSFAPLDWRMASEQILSQRWHASFASSEIAQDMRTAGQRLLGLLIQYITRLNDDSRFLHEAKDVGALYGAGAIRAGASLSESVEAFLFFRKSFSRLALQVPREAHSSDADEIVRLTHRVDEFMDAVLGGMAAGYETQGGALELPSAAVSAAAEE